MVSEKADEFKWLGKSIKKSAGVIIDNNPLLPSSKMDPAKK